MRYLENQLTIQNVNELRKSVEWRIFPKQQTQQALEKAYYNIVVMDEDSVVGMGRLIGDGIYFLICDVIVKPKYQGQGIGREIIYHLIDYIKETMVEERCSIQLVSAKGKEEFYKKMGFVSLPSEESGHGMRMSVSKKK